MNAREGRTPWLQVVAKNVGGWMRRQKMTQVPFAAKAKISQKAVSNLLNAYQKGYDVQWSTIEGAARAMGAEPWVVLLPDLPDDLTAEEYRGLDAVVRAYLVGGAENRRALANLAELILYRTGNAD